MARNHARRGKNTTRHKANASHELRLQQLRSFCETARLGSLTAAANSLGLTQPTVGEQVHALEREFDEPLVETHGRGCRLTDGGRLLAELAGPLLAGFDSLRGAYHEARQRQLAQLTVASSPRILAEDILPSVPDFERRHPEAQVSFMELLTPNVAETVKSGVAQLGLTDASTLDGESPWIETEPAYQLDLLLVTPADHPLAARRSVTLRDIAEHPVVNDPDTLSDASIRAALHKAEVFQRRVSRVHVSYTVAVRKFVKAGFGVGFVFGLPGQPVEPGLCERSVSRHVGRAQIDFVWRKGALRPEFARAFADSIKTSMQQKRRAAES
ncbi:MAG: LysR family transcriptional regulator [Pirellulaceae bacterium]